MFVLNAIKAATDDIDEFINVGCDETTKYGRNLKKNAWSGYRWLTGMTKESECAVSFRFICDVFEWDYYSECNRILGRWKGNARLKTLEKMAENEIIKDSTSSIETKRNNPNQLFLF